MNSCRTLIAHLCTHYTSPINRPHLTGRTKLTEARSDVPVPGPAAGEPNVVPWRACPSMPFYPPAHSLPGTTVLLARSGSIPLAGALLSYSASCSDSSAPCARSHMCTACFALHSPSPTLAGRTSPYSRVRFRGGAWVLSVRSTMKRRVQVLLAFHITRSRTTPRRSLCGSQEKYSSTQGAVRCKKRYKSQ